MAGPGSPTNRTLRFGPFEFDPRAGELRKFGVRLKLREQPVKVLALLLENPGEVVLRTEIRACLWPDHAAGEFDRGINVAVQKLRDTLGESADSPRFVETVARRGYRFIAEVERVAGPAAEQNDGTSRVPAAPTGAPAQTLAMPGRKPAWVWILSVVALVALAFVSGLSLRTRPAGEAVIRFHIMPPEGNGFGGMPGPAVSPDGRRVVFVATSKNGYRMWLRSLEVADVVGVPAGDGGAFPFWSPDSRSIGFFSPDGKLKRIELDEPGGLSSARILCDAPENSTGTWSSQGVILFATDLGGLYRVADTGGTPVATRGGAEGRPQVYRYPEFLPDGRHFLFVADSSPLVAAHFSIRVGSIDSDETTPVVSADSNAIYAKRRILYARGNTLVAQPFDAARLVTDGSPIPLADPIAVFAGKGNFSAAEDGPLVYLTAADSSAELVWFDRDGTRLGVFGSPLNPGMNMAAPALSLDGKHLALDRVEGDNTDVWVYDVANGAGQRFTFDPAKEVSPLWSPDGKNIVFASSRRGHYDLYRKAADGSGREEALLVDEAQKYPTSFSPDGRFLLFRRQSDQEAHESLWILPMSPPGRPFVLREQPEQENYGEFSPDGRWIAYAAVESGRFQVFVAPFYGDGPIQSARQISQVEGFFPHWSRDGKEIYFTARQKVKAIAVKAGGSMEVGPERDWIDAGATILGFAIAPDGRFLMKLRAHDAAARPLTAVQNWMSISAGSR